MAEFGVRTGLTAAQLTAKTTLIEREIERNSRTIDRITGCRFYQTTLTASKVIFNFGMNSNDLRMSDDATRIYFPSETLVITTLTSNNVLQVVDTDYFLGTNFVEAAGIFSMSRVYPVVITGTCGSATVPDDVNEICIAMTEVSTGLGTYTMIDSGGSKVEVTRDSLPDWVNDRLFMRKRFDNFG